MTWELGPFLRDEEHNPVLTVGRRTFDCPMTRAEIQWESGHVFNPAAIIWDGKVCLLYRAEDGSGDGIGTHTSRLGLAESDDGLSFIVRESPVLYPADDAQKVYEWPGGVEDPRLVELPEGGFLLTYTQWDRKTARLATATSPDLIHWTKHGPAFSGLTRDFWSKAGAMVTELRDGRLVAARIGGQFWMYWGEGQVFAATSHDGRQWEPVLDEQGEFRTLLSPRPGRFDSLLAEPGPPAILTEDGIVLLYNGRNDPGNGDPSLAGEAYSAGQALFDRHDPVRLLDRADDYFLTPERDYERAGQFSDGTVFIQGLVRFRERWMLYYGAADSSAAVAVAS